MKRRKRIGILAGMGPRSTAPFLELVYDECQMQYGAKNDIDFPEIVVFSWPTPFYVDKDINDELFNSKY
jgi:aspartate racemase